MAPSGISAPGVHVSPSRRPGPSPAPCPWARPRRSCRNRERAGTSTGSDRRLCAKRLGREHAVGALALAGVVLGDQPVVVRRPGLKPVDPGASRSSGRSRCRHMPPASPGRTWCVAPYSKRYSVACEFARSLPRRRADVVVIVSAAMSRTSGGSVIRPTRPGTLLPVNHMFPSGPAAIANGRSMSSEAVGVLGDVAVGGDPADPAGLLGLREPEVAVGAGGDAERAGVGGQAVVNSVTSPCRRDAADARPGRRSR